MIFETSRGKTVSNFLLKKSKQTWTKLSDQKKSMDKFISDEINYFAKKKTIAHRKKNSIP